MEQPAAATRSDPTPVSAQSYIKSYRYARVALVAMLGLIAVGVVYEWIEAGCFQPSISAYYYTPARAVFTGALVAVGACLIALRSQNDWEDGALNLAGICAFFVAFAPTGLPWNLDPGNTPIPPLCAPSSDYFATPEHIRAGVLNNGFAALMVGSLVVLVIAWYLIKTWSHAQSRLARGLSWVLSAAIVVAAWIWWWHLCTSTDNQTPMVCTTQPNGLEPVCLENYLHVAHGIGSVALFVMIFIAVVVNALFQPEQAARRTGWGIAGLMLVSGVAVFIAHCICPQWRHWVGTLEAVELAWFAVFWSWQSSRPLPARPPQSVDLVPMQADDGV